MTMNHEAAARAAEAVRAADIEMAAVDAGDAESAERLAADVMVRMVRQLSRQPGAEQGPGAQGVMPELRDLLEGNQVDAADQLVTARRCSGISAPPSAASTTLAGVLPASDGLVQIVARLLLSISPLLGRRRGNQDARAQSGAARKIAPDIEPAHLNNHNLEHSR
jgi:hypothetical protein